ncbi:MAG: hypothetical protein RIS91_2103 [Bacteroidota bacterium]|jgi:hypothetical protein|nr:hypothetical protein [Bacteroidia bacterium]
MAIRFEKRKQDLASLHEFTRRMILFVLFGLCFIGISLWVGAIGYRYYAHLGWVDAFYNASMILTGMGPVAILTSDDAKIFATVYSIYSGVAFLTSVGVMFAPLVHRLFHRLHIDIE